MLIAAVATVGLVSQIGIDHGWIDALNTSDSTQHEDGEFFITPENAKIDQGESVTFMSYSQVSTQAMPVKAAWTLVEENEDETEAEDEDEEEDEDGEALLPVAYASLPEESQAFLDRHSDTVLNALKSQGTLKLDKGLLEVLETKTRPVLMQGCEHAVECTITIGENPGKFTVTATLQDGSTANAVLKVSNKTKKATFRDEVPEWAKSAAKILEDRKIMTGYENGDFGATDPVSRGQLALLLYRVMLAEQSFDVGNMMRDRNCGIYADVEFGHYAFDAICFGTYYDWFDDIIENKAYFKPEEPLKRSEVAKMVYNAAIKAVTEKKEISIATLRTLASYFQDVEYDDGSNEEIGAMYLLAIMRGTTTAGEGDYLYPERVLNRAETAVILWRLIQSLESLSD